MASHPNQLRNNASSPRKNAPPAIQIDGEGAPTVVPPLLTAGTASTSVAAQASPSTPTPTLGGQAVRHSQQGSAVLTFTPASDTGSPGHVPPTAALSPLSVTIPQTSAPDPDANFRAECDQAREELRAMCDGLLLSSERDLWFNFFDENLNPAAILRALKNCVPTPRAPSSASAAWQWSISDAYQKLTASTSSSQSSTETILSYLSHRVGGVILRAWRGALEQYLPTDPSLAPPAVAHVGLAPFSLRRPTSSSVSVHARPASPSTISDNSLLVHDGHAANFYSHANRNIGSQEYPQAPATTIASHRPSSVEGQPEGSTSGGDLLRVSLDAIASEVAVISDRISNLEEIEQATEKVGQIEAMVNTLKKARDRMAVFVGITTPGSRSPAGSSPTATPTLGPSRRRLFPPSGLVVRSEEHLPYTPRSPAPWHTTPLTRAPAGAKAIITSSKSSGIYRTEAIVHLQPPSTATAAPLAHAPDSEEPRRLQQAPDPADVLPPTATSPDAIDIARLLRSGARAGLISDPNTWSALYHASFGPCLFSARTDNVDPSAPSSSTAILKIFVCCSEPLHQEHCLPCTLPTTIPFAMDLSSLLRQLEASQGARVAQLMAVVSRTFLDGGLDPNTPEGAPHGGQEESGDSDAPEASGSGGNLEKGKARERRR